MSGYEGEPSLLLSEVEYAVKKLAVGKANGIDNISSEIWKALNDEGVRILHLLCMKIWETGEWPDEWTKSVIVPLHKKGSTVECNNYRLIALITHASKVMLYILRSRLNNFLDYQIAPEQAGFVKGRGTREQILNVRILIEKAREYYTPMYMCFIDYEKAFDNVKWSKLWETLLNMGVPKHLVRLIQHLYENSKAVIKIDDRLSTAAEILKGVRQGCILSPQLFNIYTEELMREVLNGWTGGITIGGTRITNLRYADDTLLIANSPQELTDLMHRLVTVSNEYGLKVNHSKSKVMIINRANINAPTPRYIADCEVVEQFLYLGAVINCSGSCEMEIRRRIQLGRSAMTQLTKIWKDRQISLKTKTSLVNSLVFSVFWYASETWTIKAADRRRIDAFEMWCWRRMLRIPWTAHRTNISILKIINPVNRLSSITSARILKFFGHISRHNNMEKLIVQGKPMGKRRRGRSPSRWTDLVLKLTNTSMGNTIRIAENRPRWRETVSRILKEQRDHET